MWEGIRIRTGNDDEMMREGGGGVGGGGGGGFFFFKQKTAYEMCGRDWSSDVCSSDLRMTSSEFDPSRDSGCT